ncbi:MAG: nucleoside monophosphate kinase [Candidatus Doudnabacteria bacterium]|nr:nucleoside monophosphate kinase [Candidatus Doudnabacteria bacterium]
MQTVNFPVFKTKIAGVVKKFDLAGPAGRREYFEAKAGKEIAALKDYLRRNTFVGYLLGKKNSGKGTYSKLFMEAVGEEHVGHVAIGDIVRDVHAGLSDPVKKKELIGFFEKNYRGFHTLEEVVQVIEGRDTMSLIPAELVLTMIKYEIGRRPKKAIFVDGFPRALDQIAYSLFLKELIGYRDDPDFLVFIDVPEAVIDERIKYRVVCPKCKTPRNLRLLATQEVGYDAEKKEFFLICDNPTCDRQRMVAKEGDQLGIEPIRKRLEVDDQIFQQLLGLHGVAKVLLRNSVPVESAAESVDDYEITPAYDYEFDPSTKKVRVLERPWVINDDNGVPSYSLLPPAVVVSFLKQVAKVLEL